MIAVCRFNDEAKAPKEVEYIERAHSEDVHENLSVGTEYVIYAVSVYADHFSYLVRDDYGRPTWSPPRLFDLVDSRIPLYWIFRPFLIEGGERWQLRPFQALFGYPYLVENPLHSDRFQDREWDDLQLFADEVERRAQYNLQLKPSRVLRVKR